MKAAQISKYGGSEVVEIKTIDKPTIKEGQVLVEVYAAGVNPVDWKIREGYMDKMAPLNFPVTLGGDFSGVIIDAGKVSAFKVGDEVYGSTLVLGAGSGAFAEFAVAKAETIALKPKNTTYIEAAALPLVGVSAYQALVEHIKLSKGQKILIHGGAGGIGSIAIQLSKHLGAYVVATANGKDKDFVKALGADEVIDYKTQQFEKLVHDFDAVFDPAGGEMYTKSFGVLKKGGIIVSMVEQPNEQLMQQFGVTAISQFTKINTERLVKLTELVEKGIIKAHVDRVFPLDKAGEALSYLQTGHPKGKVAIEIK
ncbi:MAG TPA: NADP-dependent oxidoreductase [Patescibacteria group bacterium]